MTIVFEKASWQDVFGDGMTAQQIVRVVGDMDPAARIYEGILYIGVWDWLSCQYEDLHNTNPEEYPTRCQWPDFVRWTGQILREAQSEPGSV